MSSLKGKVAVVTGGARDIGRAISIQLAKDGAKVVVNFYNSESGANETVEEIKSFGGEAIASDYQTTLLGSLPLDLSIREFADSGKPSVIAEPDSGIASRYKAIAQKMAAQLWLMHSQADAMPEIVVTED